MFIQGVGRTWVLFQIVVVLSSGLTAKAGPDPVDLGKPGSQAEVNWVGERLKELFIRYPSVRIIADQERLGRAAIAAFGPENGARFNSFVADHRDEFHRIRAQTDANTPVTSNGKTAVVSGSSVVGMMQALMLVRQGYHVVLYERRADWGRNIQWALRQSLYDELESISPKLAEKVREEAARDLKTSVQISEDGSKKSYPTPGGSQPDPGKVPLTGAKMLALPSVMSTDSRIFTNLFAQYMKEHADSITFKNEKMELQGPDAKGRFSVRGLNKRPDEIVLVEGANSRNRAQAGIDSIPTTDSRFQLAGEVYLKGTGRMTKHFRREAGDRMVTYTMETGGSPKIWVVGDIRESAIDPGSKFPLKPSDAFVPGTLAYDKESVRLKKEYDSERARLREFEFRRLAAGALEVPEAEIRDTKVAGPYDGVGPSAFWLDQRISTSAISGTNVRLAGDAVGNATPTVGGGMQVGTVSHTERAKQMYLDLDLLNEQERNHSITPVEAEKERLRIRRKYSDDVIADTLVWHRIGVPDMYLYMGDGTKIQKLPADSPLSAFHNANVDRLEKEIKSFTEDEVRRRSTLPADDYYRIPPEEVTTPEGVAKWRGKLIDWAYQDFIRRAFDEGIKLYQAKKVATPLEYMKTVLPPRPESASEKFRPQIFRADPYTFEIGGHPHHIEPRYVSSTQYLDEGHRFEIGVYANIKNGQVGGTFCKLAPNLILESVTTPDDILREGLQVWVNGEPTKWRRVGDRDFEPEYLEWSASGDARTPKRIEIKFYGRTIGVYHYDPLKRELVRTIAPREVTDFDLREFYSKGSKKCAVAERSLAI